MTKSRTLKDWENGTRKDALSVRPERRRVFSTSSGEEIQALYNEESRTGGPEDPGFPGEYPFTRGIYPSMYRGQFWTMRQYAGFGDAGLSNERYKYLLNQGQTGLSVAFDLPTQIGYDSDHPLSNGEVGKVGVAIDSLQDMELLFREIPLDKVSTSMTINAPAPILLAMYIAVAEKRGISPEKLSGTIQNDILKEYVARGTFIFPPRPSMRLITDIFEYCRVHIPKWNTISISGYHIREAGSDAAQEIGFTLADGIAYVQAALDAGLDVDAFAGRLSFFFNAHNNLFEEVAKFRAARRLWASIMKDRFHAHDEKSMMLRFHTQTGGSTLTAQQPDNNIVRVTLQALAAVLGGTQSLHTNGRDEALALPTEDSVRTALRTQQLLAHESGVADSIDPLGGSWLVESLTDSLEAKAREYIAKIDDLGGMIEAIEQGYVQREIQASAYRAQQEVETGEAVIVGVNKYRDREEPQENLLSVNPALQALQVRRLSILKSGRDSAAVKTTLEKLKNTAAGSDNIMPAMIEAVKSYATIGEISDTLRSVFGEYRETIVI